MEKLGKLFSKIDAMYDEMVKVRRHLHMHPEISFNEEKTAAFIADYLRGLGIEVKENVGGRGVVGRIVGGGKTKTVALRADFDALALTDEKTVPYASKTPGVMHACGHDAHTAGLLAVAKVLSQNKEYVTGEVRFIFQHAEEVSPGGAIAMIEDGCLDGVDAIFGTHIWSSMNLGTYGYRVGPIMAVADRFVIDIIGKGGHGASPQHTIDPISLGASIITGLQQIVARRIDPQTPAVLSFGQFISGSAFNVIPNTAMIEGTTRSYSKEVQDRLILEMERVVKGHCDAAGARYSFTYEKGYPAVVNHKEPTEALLNCMKGIVSKDSCIELTPKMGGEDFSYYLEKVPGSFFFTGSSSSPETSIAHHHPLFDIDERAMLYAAKALTAIALTY